MTQDRMGQDQIQWQVTELIMNHFHYKSKSDFFWSALGTQHKSSKGNKTVLLRERHYQACIMHRRVASTRWCYPRWGGGTYPGGGVPTLVGGTYPGGGVPTLVGGVPTLVGGTWLWWGGGTYPGGEYLLWWGGTYPGGGVPTLVGGYLPWWGVPTSGRQLTLNRLR